MVDTNHEHAPIEIRERLWCRPEILPSRLESLVHDSTREAVILSTCNRTEIYVLTPADSKIVTDIKSALSQRSGVKFVAEATREEELSTALRKLGDVPNRENVILELMPRRIVNKLLYGPALRLKEHASIGEGVQYEAVIRENFDMGRQTET